MKPPLTPPAKKQRSYERDHIVRSGENDKAYRRWRPRKKAKIRRANRHRLNHAARLLYAASAADASAPSDACASDLRAVVLESSPVKWGVTPLGEHVKWLLARRASQQLDVWDRYIAIKAWVAAADSPRQISLQPPDFTPIKP